MVADNGSADYDEQSTSRAPRRCSRRPACTTPIDVRFLFAANNPRRANEYELIRYSAKQAGFEVLDNSSPTWGQELPTPSLYDASLFGWASIAVTVSESEPAFRPVARTTSAGTRTRRSTPCTTNLR